MHSHRRLVVVLAVALLLGSLMNLSGLAGMATAAGAWSAHGPSGGTVTALKVSPSGDSTIYAGTGGAGVFVSATGAGPGSAAAPACRPMPSSPTSTWQRPTPRWST
jgi:hypothetical protein